MLSKKQISALLLIILSATILLQSGSESFQVRIEKAYAAAISRRASSTVILTSRSRDTTALEEQVNALRREHRVTEVRRLSQDRRTVIVNLASSESAALIAALSTNDDVQVEQDYTLQATAAPVDSVYSEQWALHNTGQTYHISASSTTHGTDGIDINWQPTFEHSSIRGNGVTIAVIDTGVSEHADLSGQMWTNTGETSDGVDNDHNGFIDDVHGWNFVEDNTDITDTFGHGTQVAGIIAAKNDSTGVVGIAPAAKIMALRVLGSDGSGTTSDVIQAINYAVENGAKVINMSLGAPFADSLALINACNNAVAHGVVVVAAAGNSNADIDSFHFAPANIPSVIAAGSVSNTGTKASFSNTGNALALVTPGIQIVSTRSPGTGSISQVLPDGSDSYIISSGTSFSSPMVAGAAALVLSQNPLFTVTQVRDQLQNNARDLGATGKDASFGYGLLDITKTLDVSATPPSSLPNHTPRLINATWSPTTFSNENNDYATITVNASDADNDTLTVTADLSSLGLSTQTLEHISGTTYRLSEIVPTVSTGTYTVPVHVSDGTATVNKNTKLRVSRVLSSIHITRPSTRSDYSTGKTTVVLSGTSRGDIRSIQVNGETLSSFIFRQHRWSTTLTLATGSTVYTVVGYNNADEEVARSSITITKL